MDPLYDIYNGLPQIFTSTGLISCQPSLKMCSSQGIFCEFMIRGATAPVFNLTLALKNVTDSTHPPPPPLPPQLQATDPMLFSPRCSSTSLVVKRGYGFLYFELKKQQQQQWNISTSWNVPTVWGCRGTEASEGPLKGRFMSGWLNTKQIAKAPSASYQLWNVFWWPLWESLVFDIWAICT